MTTHIEALQALLKESNARGNDLSKRNKALDLLIGPTMFDKYSGEQTDRLIHFTIDMIKQGKAFVKETV